MYQYRLTSKIKLQVQKQCVQYNSMLLILEKERI